MAIIIYLDSRKGERSASENVAKKFLKPNGSLVSTFETGTEKASLN
jgi:hypothetical protein